jgi:hypothetical protein
MKDIRVFGFEKGNLQNYYSVFVRPVLILHIGFIYPLNRWKVE